MEIPPDLCAFAESLNAAKVKFVIVGGYAVAYHGHPRFTGDIDFFVENSAENAARIVAAIDLFGFGSLGLKAEDFLPPDVIVQIGYPPHRVDVMTSVETVSFAEAWASRQNAVVDNVPVSFLAKDLLIRNKKAVGRAKDLADIKGLETAP